jgi:type II secretory pathway pseudopilin PulG
LAKSIASKNGVSTMELIVVVGMIAVIAIVSLPAYESYVMKGRQALAKSDLAMIYATQKRFQGQFQSYHYDLSKMGFMPEGRWGNYGVALDRGRAYALTQGTPVAPLPLNLSTGYGINVNVLVPQFGSPISGTPHYSFGASPGNCTIVSTPTGPDDADAAMGAPTAYVSQTNFEAHAIGCPRNDLTSTSSLDRWSINDSKTITNVNSGL